MIGWFSPSASILCPFTSRLIIWVWWRVGVCLAAYFFSSTAPALLKISNWERVWSHVAACCLATTVIDHDAASLSLSLSTSVYVSGMQTTFSKNPSCLIIQLHSVCGFKQHPVLGTRPPQSSVILLLLLFGPALAAAQTVELIRRLYFTLWRSFISSHKNIHCQKSCSFTLLIMDIMNNESQQLWHWR